MTETTRRILSEKVPQLSQKIERLMKRKDGIGEQNTKAALIDPLLDALGWEIRDPDEVCREYKSKPTDKPVDYALLLLRSPRLFIEAKALGSNLTDRKWISQILGYATVVGVEWCVLTDGDEYRIYNAHAPVDVEEKLFRKVRLSDPEREAFTIDTLGLLSKSKLEENLLAVHWKAHFVDRQVKAAVEELIQGESKSLIRLIRKRIPRLNPSEIRDSLRRADIRIDFPLIGPDVASLSEVAPAPRAKKPKAKGMKGKRKSPAHFGVSLADLIREGYIAPPLELERTYKGEDLRATIHAGGTVTWGGEEYESLSTAAGMARKSIIGATAGRPYPQTNGWTFWKFRDQGTGKLHEVNELRQQYIRQHQETD